MIFLPFLFFFFLFFLFFLFSGLVGPCRGWYAFWLPLGPVLASFWPCLLFLILCWNQRKAWRPQNCSKKQCPWCNFSSVTRFGVSTAFAAQDVSSTAWCDNKSTPSTPLQSFWQALTEAWLQLELSPTEFLKLIWTTCLTALGCLALKLSKLPQHTDHTGQLLASWWSLSRPYFVPFCMSLSRVALAVIFGSMFIVRSIFGHFYQICGSLLVTSVSIFDSCRRHNIIYIYILYVCNYIYIYMYVIIYKYVCVCIYYIYILCKWCFWNPAAWSAPASAQGCYGCCWRSSWLVWAPS